MTVVPLSLANSSVTVTPATISADGTATFTFTARDTDGSQETKGGWTVAFALGSGTGHGTVGPVTDNGDGTYTATFFAQDRRQQHGFRDHRRLRHQHVAAPTINITNFVRVTGNPTSQSRQRRQHCVLHGRRRRHADPDRRSGR